MTATDFTNLLAHPKKVDDTSTRDLKAVIFKYPYLQAARALHLKGLKNNESHRYNDELKTTAAYTTDRSILFDFITSEAFLQNDISKRIKRTEELKQIEVSEEEDISVHKKVIIDNELQERIKNTKGVLDPELFEAKNPWQVPVKTNFSLDERPIDTSPQETLQLGKPLEFDKTEIHSFGEWLKLTSFKPIIRKTRPEVHLKTTSTKDKKFELIDKFIENNPKISPIKKETPTISIVKDDQSQSESLMTETLARIYLEQKNYKKAIQSYKILSLKYPEKSGFFADQIKAVKKLQEQNKKE